MIQRRGLLIILSSPSGAGKSTLSRRLLEWDSDIAFSVSATTRPPRKGEIDGKDYHFLSEQQFEKEVQEKTMLEHAYVFGNRYGSPKFMIERTMEKGRDVLFDIDWQGAVQIMNSNLSQHTLSIFLLPPSIKELHRRLTSRGQDSEEVIEQRMRKSWGEISHWSEYDYVMINDDMERAFSQLKTIIEAARLRRLQQPDLNAHVNALYAEFEDMK